MEKNYSEPNPTKLTRDQIAAILQRSFGAGLNSFEAQELGGGTFNETYLIDISLKVILRVAPHHFADPYWDDVALIRHEHTILPFFASIAALIPTTLFADFTHQIIARDYVLQTFLEGDRWSDIEEELTEEDNIDIWRQCGEIVKRIHETTGEQFGYPHPGRSFAIWHDVIIDRFSRLAQSLKEYQADNTHFSDIFDLVNSAASIFNEVQTPHLLHGDLWTFNLLVTRQNGKPVIRGVLDTERAWWGDPLADWMIFLLSIRSEEEEWKERISAFYHGYGALDKNGAAQFRQEPYNAMHIGSSMAWALKHGNREDVKRGNRDLQRISSLLLKL